MNTTASSSDQIDWIISDDLVDYLDAIRFMEQRAHDIRGSNAADTVWLLEHPPLYTAGTSASPDELVSADRFPVYETGRGGRYTYHGPGQRIAYVMMDLKNRNSDVRAYVHDLEEWVIRTLALFNVKGERRNGRVGIWVDRGNDRGVPGQEDKIAAIGVRVSRWVTYHGISINVEPNLEHFSGIIPCGIAEHGITSLVDLGITTTTSDVDNALMQAFDEVFG